MNSDSSNCRPMFLWAMDAAWGRVVRLLLSLLISSVVVAAVLQHVAFHDTLRVLLLGLIATALLSGVLMFILRRLVQELHVCDPALRQLIAGLMAGGVVVAFFSTSTAASRALTWYWDAGSQTGSPAPTFLSASWDEVERSVIELHATDNPSATPYGVWRARAPLDGIASMQPAQIELWLTQPSWAVIDPAMSRPVPNADGVDVVVGVQRGQNLLLERRIALDLPASPEQGRWHHVTLNPPPDSEYLIVEVQMRRTLDNDRVWVTEAVVRPVWNSMLDRVALALTVVFAASTLVFAGRIPQIVSMSRHVSVFLSNYGYLLVGAACLWLGYLLVWQRGLYLDDWSMGLRARDRQTLEWMPINFTPEAIPTFPARILTFIILPRLIALMWTDEFLVRLLIACCVGLNAFLLGWLVYRMLHTRLAAIVAGWLFLMPIYTDVTLWAGAAVYVFITGLTLLMLHAVWSALVVDSSAYILLLFGCLIWLIVLMFAEATVGAISVIPLMGILYCVRRPGVKWRVVAYRTILGTIVPTIVVVLYGFLMIDRSPLASQRGEITIDITMIVQRAYDWLRALYWFTLDPTWGHQFAVSSYVVGSDHILSSHSGIALLSLISIFLGLTVVSWRKDRQISKVSEILLVPMIGIVWFLATLFLPYLLVSRQIFEIRFLYFPLAGLSIAAGALIALITSIIRHRGLQQMLLAVCGVLLVILSVCMVGYARLYKVRYEHDVNTFIALKRLAPFEAIPEHVQFIPVNLDYSLPGKENLLTGLIVSAFEAPWSARAGLGWLVYPGKKVEYIASSRWMPATFSERVPDEYPMSCSTNYTGINVFVQGCPIDAKRAIVFTQRNGELALVRTLTLQRSDGTTRIVELPLVSSLSTRGAKVIETLVVPVKD